jgi:hypothetical protein
LNEEEGRWQVMPAEKKPHRASSAALAHLDELLDEALEQTFPASDAFHSSASWRRGSLCNEKSLHHRSAIEAKGVCKNWFRASLPAVLASSQEAKEPFEAKAVCEDSTDFGLVIPEGKLARFVSATDSEVSVAIGMLPTQAAL